MWSWAQGIGQGGLRWGEHAGREIQNAAVNTYQEFGKALQGISDWTNKAKQNIEEHVKPEGPAGETIRETRKIFRTFETIVKGTACEIKKANLTRKIRQWIKAHPYQTAFLALGLNPLCFPQIITVPMLGILGFTSAGPTGFAAVWMSILGPIHAGSLFSVLQSAAMAGYGAVIMAGVVQAVVVLVLVTRIGVIVAKAMEGLLGRRSTAEVKVD